MDLYWLHNYDPVTPIEETLRALDDLVTAGKVRYVGLSDLPAWKVAEAATIAQFRRLGAGHRAPAGVFAAGADVRGRADPGGRRLWASACCRGAR